MSLDTRIADKPYIHTLTTTHPHQAKRIRAGGPAMTS